MELCTSSFHEIQGNFSQNIYYLCCKRVLFDFLLDSQNINLLFIGIFSVMEDNIQGNYGNRAQSA